jgi:hypothetical protein
MITLQIANRQVSTKYCTMYLNPLVRHPVNKAVNREDKRSRRYRDRDLAKFERSRRYRHRYRC